MCIDDPVVGELLTDVGRPVITYGFSDDAGLHACDVPPKGSGAHFTVCFDDGTPDARREAFHPIGRASRRESVCRSVESWRAAVAVNKNLASTVGSPQSLQMNSF